MSDTIKMPLMDSHESPCMGMAVLLIEDNSINALIERQMLESLGCEVMLADSLVQALDLLREKQFDLILVDMHLSDASGDVLLAQLRDVSEEYQSEKSLPMVLVTADPNAAERYSHGGCPVLIKPLYREQLRCAIERALTDRV